MASPYEEGSHTTELILRAEEIVKSPGIPEKAPIMVAIRERGIPRHLRDRAGRSLPQG